MELRDHFDESTLRGSDGAVARDDVAERAQRVRGFLFVENHQIHVQSSLSIRPADDSAGAAILLFHGACQRG
jgi:hypothetical protein